MKAKPSPGPWTVMADHGNTNKRWRMALVVTGHGRQAIDVTDSGDTYAETCANARLVAEAPALLELVHHIVNGDNPETIKTFAQMLLQQIEGAR